MLSLRRILRFRWRKYDRSILGMCVPRKETIYISTEYFLLLLCRVCKGRRQRYRRSARSAGIPGGRCGRASPERGTSFQRLARSWILLLEKVPTWFAENAVSADHRMPLSDRNLVFRSIGEGRGLSPRHLVCRIEVHRAEPDDRHRFWWQDSILCGSRIGRSRCRRTRDGARILRSWYVFREWFMIVEKRHFPCRGEV